jgi:hypothetical protein
LHHLIFGNDGHADHDRLSNLKSAHTHARPHFFYDRASSKLATNDSVGHNCCHIDNSRNVCSYRRHDIGF